MIYRWIMEADILKIRELRILPLDEQYAGSIDTMIETRIALIMSHS